MKKIFILFFLCMISACTWEYGHDESGKIKVNQKYPVGTPVYYEEGTYNHDQRFNQYRPVERAILDETK